MCVGVTLWYGCGGVVSVCRLRQVLSYFMGCIDLVRCVSVLRCGMAVWCGIRMQAEAGAELFHGLY